jgi:hypothetical protein
VSAASLYVPLGDGGDGRWLPTELSRGPWSPDALHGGPVAALLAHVAGPLLDDVLPARSSVELLRPAPVAALTASAEVLRPGRKVRLVSARLATDDGTVVATATFLGIRRLGVEVPAQPPSSPPPPPPSSAEPAVPAELAVAAGWEAFHNRAVEHRFVAGAFSQPGPATDWIRLCVPVVPGAEPSPLERVLAAADFANGISNVADFQRLAFTNPDLTVALHRLPAGEWVCLEARTVLEAHGTGMAESALWDEAGPLGRSLQSLIVEPR